MVEKINIVEILKDKPQGTKLYSSACGKCKLEEVDDKSFKISFYNSKFGFMNGGDGYKVVYEGGYESWSPKDVFEKAYREVGSVNFGGAIDLLKAGLAVRRKGWNGKGLFIVKQVPSHITSDIIPNMQSLPQSAKSILMSRENPHIDYTNQMLIINPDGRADSWVPSVSDVFAEDWEVVTE